MYRIDKTNYGIKITFREYISEEDIEKWFIEAKEILPLLPKDFCVYGDLRETHLLPSKCQQQIIELQWLYRLSGLLRSVIVFDNYITTLQFKRIAKS